MARRQRQRRLSVSSCWSASSSSSSSCRDPRGRSGTRHQRLLALWATTVALLLPLRTNPQTFVEARSTSITTAESPTTSMSTAAPQRHDRDTSSSPRSKTTTYYIWEEKITDDSQHDPSASNLLLEDNNIFESDIGSSGGHHRPIIPRMSGWKIFGGRSTSSETSKKTNFQAAADSSEPHPLRTNLWELHIHWRGPAAAARKHKRRSSSSPDLLYSSDKLLLEFDPSGYVRVKRGGTSHTNTDKSGGGGGGGGDNNEDDGEDGISPWIATGKWSNENSPSGLSFSIPLPCPLDDDDKSNSKRCFLQHHFEADLHMNPFGQHAKLTRGIVVRDRPANRQSLWFRPVVGTFSGIGIGQDTVDLSYQKRQAPRQV